MWDVVIQAVCQMILRDEGL